MLPLQYMFKFGGQEKAIGIEVKIPKCDGRREDGIATKSPQVLPNYSLLFCKQIFSTIARLYDFVLLLPELLYSVQLNNKSVIFA
jgi:hypothetical protein